MRKPKAPTDCSIGAAIFGVETGRLVTPRLRTLNSTLLRRVDSTQRQVNTFKNEKELSEGAIKARVNIYQEVFLSGGARSTPVELNMRSSVWCPAFRLSSQPDRLKAGLQTNAPGRNRSNRRLFLAESLSPVPASQKTAQYMLYSI
jgi:hypothetical protein